jgi:hypothetical protein
MSAPIPRGPPEAERVITLFVPCIYCRAAILKKAFQAWPSTQKLLSAGCPFCHRRMTLAAITLQEWPAPAP